MAMRGTSLMVAGLLAAGWGGVASAGAAVQREGPAAAAPAAREADRFFRIVERDGGGTISVQSGVHTYEPVNGKGPTITLAPAIHIGDRAFYEQLQAMLDAKDLVLFEGVKPAGTGRAELDRGADDDAARARRTKQRIRLVAIAAKMQKNASGAFPESLERVVAGTEDPLKPYISGAAADAWGRGLSYAVVPWVPEGASEPAKDEAGRAITTIEITSLGSDGAPGGEGTAADMKLSDQPGFAPGEVPASGGRGGTRGLQQEMASALGLVFQLDAMRHDKPNWRNSDLSIDQLQDREGVGDSSSLINMLQGSGFQARLARLVLGVMKVLPAARTLGRLALVEALVRADDLLKVAGAAGMDQRTMDVILHDRNQVVLADLKRALGEEPGLKSIAVIYGGGHMPGIEPEVLAMGYRETGVEWLEAMRITAEGSGMSVQQIRQMRTSIADGLDQQIAALRKREAKERE